MGKSQNFCLVASETFGGTTATGEAELHASIASV
jgi:hypothetical protein